jgi:hypothetical protein
MIVSDDASPWQLWEHLALGLLHHEQGWIDDGSANQWISYHNLFTVQVWPRTFTACGLFEVSGYRPQGSKFATLINHYVDPARLRQLKQEYQRRKKSRDFAIGMNFTRGVSGRGACLGGFDIIQHRARPWVTVYSKIVEFPKRFTADMRLLAWLIRELDIPEPRVTWFVPKLFTTHRIFFKVLRNLHGEDWFKREVPPQYRRWLTFNPGIIEGTQQNTLQFWKERTAEQRRHGTRLERETGEYAPT